MILVLCVIMDIHPRVRVPSLMELRLGILCNVQAHFLLTHIPLGWHDPNETPAFPRWQWAMLLHSVGAGERGDPSLPNGLSWKNRRPRRLLHISHAHIHSVAPFTPSGSPAHFQGNFDMSNYWGLESDRSIPGFNRRTEEKRTDNRLELPLGLRQCVGLSELHVCLPLLSPLGGF